MAAERNPYYSTNGAAAYDVYSVENTLRQPVREPERHELPQERELPRKRQEEQLLLQSKYEGKIDLAGIEEQAETLGLRKPSQEQIVYVNLAGTDQAEIYKTEKSSILSEIIGAVEQSISDLIAYLHPAAA